MKIRNLNTRSARIEMLPLIDIVFLLLVVFIYTMLSMAVHKGMPVDLPAGESIQPGKTASVSVSVTKTGTIFVNKQTVNLEQLSQTLKTLPGAHPDMEVWLFADRELSYEQLFRVLDRIRKTGLHRISLQAELEQIH